MTDIDIAESARPAKERLAAQMMRLFAGSAGVRILGMAFSFLLGVQLARYLGVEQYGVYGIAMSVVSVLSITGEFGLPQLVVRESAAAHAQGDWGRFRSVLSWARRSALYLSAGTLVCAGVVLFATVEQGALRSTLIAGCWLVPLVSLGKIDGATLRGMQRVVVGQVPEVVARPAIFSLLLAGGAVLGRQMTASVAMAFGAAAAGFALIVSRTLLTRQLPRGTGLERVPVDGALRASALPMAMAEGARVLHGHLVTLVMGALASSIQVGSFRAASSIALILAMPVTVVTVVVSPMMSRHFARGELDGLQKLVALSAVSMTAANVMLFVPFALLGDGVLEVLLGSGYGSANTPLLVLAGGGVVSSLFGPGAVLLTMTGHEKRVLVGVIASLCVMLVVAPVLIVFRGATGAALASSLGLCLWSLLMWLEARRRLLMDCSVFGLRAKVAGVR